MKLFYLIISYLLLIYLCHATITPSDKGKHKKEPISKRGPVNESIFERQLIQKEPLANDILVHNAAYYKDTSLRHFNGTVLGYVTAWNSHGYDIAKIFAKKFDIISPVWFQIIKNNENYEIAGTHDIDNGWLRDVRRKSKTIRGSIKILPRIIFDKFTERDYTRLLSYEKERTKVNELIVNLCLNNNFDGITLEFWLQLAGRVADNFLYKLVIELANALKVHNLHLILVIPPYRTQYPDFFGAKHVDHLYKHVYAFSLMTYDYSTIQRPGANAPLEWVRNSIEHVVPEDSKNMQEKRAKILMGLNMYGNDFTPDGGDSILGGKYLELLKNVKKRLSYSENDVENYFEIKIKSGRHYVFYPTLHSINARIQLAQQLGCGISIWELGQGLDYFYDLF